MSRLETSPGPHLAAAALATRGAGKGPRHGESLVATQVPQPLRRGDSTDGTACEALFRQHVGHVYALARRLTRNAADAEDVVQEVFIQAFRSIHTYRGEVPVWGWLRRLVVRICWQQQQHAGRRRRLWAALVNEHGDAPCAEAVDVIDSREALSRLHELLGSIDGRRRLVFLLHHVEGYPLREVAALIGASVTATKKLVFRARQDLARLASDDPLLAPLFEGD